MAEFEHLLSIEELAKYCNRHPQIIRRYYSQGVLPEPAHSQTYKRKTMRKFTIKEAEEIKRMFDNARWGTFAKTRRHVQKVAQSA